MWLSKFLDLKDDLKDMKVEIKNALFSKRESKKITPLEFTILEKIFNYKEISGYDLIQSLNRLFAGTWKAKSGTIYPMLSKLSNNGFLKVKTVKSPIGPLKKVYELTEAGEELLKYKVNKNFKDQLQFLENFIVELSSIYIHSFQEEKQTEQLRETQKIIHEMLNRIAEKIPLGVEFKMKCPNCGLEMERSNATFCSVCGSALHGEEKLEEEDNFSSAEKLNGT
ncbi:MAG: helix-turn-helix transcriptional regulator [Promethearchaeota archaeon]